MWDKICENSIEFASKHRVNTEFSDKRRQAKKRMADELTPDECMTRKCKLKVKTFIRVLDEVNLQLSSRLKQHNGTFMRQMAVFMPLNLLCDDSISAKADGIKKVRVQYSL